MGTYAVYVNESAINRYFVKANNEIEAEKMFNEGEGEFDPWYFQPDFTGEIVNIEKIDE